jgi:hypothetical protein
MNSTDDKHSDKDLKAYLDGRDGVSAAYRKAAREEPPAALDAAILKAARAEVGLASAKPEKRRVYALAASVMVAAVAASLYFRLPEDAGPIAANAEQASTRNFDRALDQDAGAPAPAPEGQNEEAATPQQDFQVRQLAPPAQTVGAETAPARARDVEATTDTLARAAEPAAIVIDGPLLERIEAEAADAQTLQAAPREEITVTGSRITRQRDAADLSYRESRDEWLSQIRILSIELQRSSRLLTANQSTAVLTAQLEEEMELFAEQYPEIDLDVELER